MFFAKLEPVTFRVPAFPLTTLTLIVGDAAAAGADIRNTAARLAAKAVAASLPNDAEETRIVMLRLP